MAWQAGRQILHRLKDGGIGRYSDLQKARMKETARVYALLGQMYYYDRGSSTLGIYSGLYSLNLAERVGPSPELANAYANMQGGLTLASGSLAKLVEIYGRRALETAQSINDQPSLVWALITSAFYWMGAGKWGLAERYAAQAAEVGERVGNYRQWAEALTILSQVHYFQGKYRESWKVNDRIKALVERTNNLAHRRWTLSMIALNALRMGEHAVAIDAVQQSLRITQESLPDDYYYFETYSLIALGMTFKGDLNEAEGYADRALKAMPEFAAASSIRVEIYGALASTYLTLAESAGESGKRADYLAQADRALQMARENAKIFPISGSPVALYEGCLLAIRGDLDKARKFWELASQKAAPYPLPYEMGRAQTLLGSSYPPASAERQRHLLEAQRIFNEIGATYDLDLVTHGLHEG
jgi:tetratricopeptide (TPR) repeat protein